MERLILKKFGPITKLDIELKKINIFIGEQGVGKSTVAKLLSCVRDLFLHYTIIVEPNEKNSILAIFKTYGIQDYFDHDTYIEYCEDSGLTVKYDDGKFSIFHSTLDKQEIKNHIEKALQKSVEDILTILELPKGTELSEEIMQKHGQIIVPNMRTSFYLPAERGFAGTLSASIASIMLAKIPLPRMLLEYLSFFEKAKNKFSNYEVPFLSLSFSSDDNEEMVSIDGKKVPFKFCSSGIQSIIPLMMVVDYCLENECFNSFALEEPELSLFPNNQLELMRFLFERMNREKGINALLITTHSPYLLSILNISILANKIIDLDPQLLPEVSSVLRPDYHVSSDEIGVFSLGKRINETSYCEDIVDQSTGLVKANYLDAVSDIISSDFSKLYKLYIKALKSGK